MLLSIYSNMINWLQQHQLPCLFKSVFHFDCPGCGLQRSVVALLKGDVVQSAQLYPAVFPILLLFIYSAYFMVKKQPGGLKGIKFLFIISASVIFIHYIYKILNC